jgi:uncharacterized protein
MKEQFIFLFALVCTSLAAFAQTTDQGPVSSSEGTNRLGETTSPYLLQHQHNPVHWYAWGEEAFKAAREQNKLIFLSIGYSTCYWCHVMERECFENQEVADWLNKDFIAIKVDREERPDIDEIYMTALQLMTRGRGGWPISLFLEPTDLKPIWGATYLSKSDFINFMQTIQQKWETEKDVISERANLIANAVISRLTSLQEKTPLSSEVVEQGVSSLLTKYDSSLGGFSSRPKFPMPIYSDFLMEAGWEIPQVQKAVKKTLDSMLMGGMYDQVGGGFHRYSTDAKWLVPHFEKMLYDNGQLVSTYAKAYELLGEATYAKVIEETLAYIDRELSAPDGGFFSAQDAETNHLEGETYLWREAQVHEALTAAGMEDEIEFALSVYGVDQGTNFQDPHHEDEPETNVLFFSNHPERLASKHKMSYEEFRVRLDAVNKALLAVRDTRDQPSTDDKIITAWNGIMIAGYANAGKILQNDAWVNRASVAATFILSEMKSNDGKLLRTWRNGKGGAEAFLIDYASLVRGLLAIYEANRDESMLDEAITLYGKARELFYVDGEGWYDTEQGKSDLFVRTRALSDGAIPAASSYILGAQISLSKLTNDSRFLQDAMATLDAESQMLSASPLSAVVATMHLNGLLDAHPEKFNEEFEYSIANQSTVRMSCEPSSITLSKNSKMTIHVQLQMAKNWHVNTNNPGSEYSVPLSFTAIGEGVTIEPAWPEGETMISAGESVSVFGESVTIPITISANENANGSVNIIARWQSCNESTCLNPEENRVPCAIVVE